jgi:hypothetical protein
MMNYGFGEDGKSFTFDPQTPQIIRKLLDNKKEIVAESANMTVIKRVPVCKSGNLIKKLHQQFSREGFIEFTKSCNDCQKSIGEDETYFECGVFGCECDFDNCENCFNSNIENERWSHYASCDSGGFDGSCVVLSTVSDDKRLTEFINE